jgi:F-type H+-transporting ATPase subunit b|tara:strand:+ start:26337 stop:26807 length:471 start_codon:yes stop_codon:yes gene_type:complete
MEEIFSVFGVDWRLLVIQTINFGVLLAVLWYFLYRPVVRLLEERRKKIEQGVKDSEEAALERASVQDERIKTITKATQEAEQIVSGAREHGKEQGSELIKNAEQKSDQILNDARARGEEERKQALSKSEEEIARMAVLSAEKILRQNSGQVPRERT